MRVIFRWSVKNACAWIGYAPPVIATYSKSTRENDHQPAEYDLVASYFQRKPRSGHYAIYGKQPLSGCQTISLEGAEPATGLSVLKHIQWYQFKSVIPNVWKAIFGLYFQYIAFRYLRIIIINCNHCCYGYFSTLEDRRKTQQSPATAAGIMLYHWATLTRPAFSLDAKMRMEPWFFEWWVMMGTPGKKTSYKAQE